MNELRFQKSNDCLYAANTGQVFDRTGIVSICTQFLSSKGARADKIEVLNCPDSELVGAIRDLQIRSYELNPNQLIADRNAEEETARDYAGRCILELLQNADDAMAPEGTRPAELIGAKGLGFKAVLEITDQPKVFSGPFSFGFDQVRSRECLKGLAVSSEVSVFKIPHLEPRDEIVKRLLSEGFATVIQLPLRNAEVRARIEAELEEFQPHFLLLSQHLKRVDIEIGAKRRQLQRSGGDGSRAGAEATLRVKRARKIEQESNWRIWRDIWAPQGDDQKRLSIAIAIQVVGGRLAPTATPLPIHVFYPTEEQVAADFLIHASFDVTQNRQRIRPGANDAELLGRIAALTARIADNEPPVDVLQVFKRLAREAPRTRPKKLLPRMIAHSIRESLVETEFVPVIGRGARRVAPHEARIATAGFAGLLNAAKRAVAEAGIVKSELEPVHAVLLELEAKNLGPGDYAELFRHVRCQSIDECVVAAKTMQRTCLAGVHVAPTTLRALKEAPIWRLTDGRVRSLATLTPLLLSLPDGWPKWCKADALDNEFVAAIFPNRAIPKEWDRLVGKVLLLEQSQYLERCIAPTVALWSDEEWSQFGWDALAFVEQWGGIGEWAKIKPYAPQAKLGSTREALVKVMRAPTPRGWVRGRICYARTELKGPGSLARFFRNVPGRELCGYPGEAKQRFGIERWRALLRYLGVSWEPKILLLDGDPDAVLPSPDRSVYSSEIYRADGLRYLDLDWCLEAFPMCLGDPGPAATLMEMVASVQLTCGDLCARWHKVLGTEKTHIPTSDRSFVSFQLRRSSYLPVRPNIWGKRVVGGRDAFWPQSGIRGITPDLDLAGFKDPRRGVLRPQLSAALRFRTKLPEAWSEWIEWNAVVVAAVERGQVPGGLRSVREFYELMLETKAAPEAMKPAKVACVDSSSTSGLKAVARKEAAWIDRPALATPEVLDALAAAGLSYLPALLGTAPHADERLGIARASKKVSIVPAYEDSPGSQSRIERRLDARWRALAVQCEFKRIKVPSRPTLRAVHGLTLTISFGGERVTEIASAAFKEGDEWLIDLSNEWEAVAIAVSDGIGHAADLRYRFAGILRAQNQDAVLRLLLEDGIPSYKLATLRLDDGDDEEVVDLALPAQVLPEEAPPAPANDVGASLPLPAVIPSPPLMPAPTTPTRPAGNQYASGILSHRPLYDPPSEPGSSGAGGSSWGGKQAAGLAGEEWLRQLVAAKLPKDWSITLNERDEASGESDIIVRSSTAEWHIEVKTLSTERFYWSNLEREKAERQPDRYWMCFLVRQGYAWRIHWSWDPLVDLLACERRLQWQWARESEGPKFAKGSWKPIGGTTTPMSPPDRATAVVRILDGQMRDFPEDDHALTLFWERAQGRGRNSSVG